MIYRFFNARDAILQADMNLTGGENKCEIWSGFAERGLVSSILRLAAIKPVFLTLVCAGAQGLLCTSGAIRKD